MKYNILDYFHYSVNKAPNKAAIIEGDNYITFQDLQLKTKILAKYLVCNFEENNKPIAIYLPKSIQSVIANIAITFSANIYMHLDIKNPSERILNILNLIQPRIIITNSLYLKELVKLPSNIIIINIDEINFDEKIITYKELLNVFWSCHNPTTLNRQGPDIGKQYRSAIFYLNDKQRLEAEESKKIMNETMFDNNIVTEITKFDEFYLAEEYHQKYLKKLGKY